jgi:hypothetical protein
MMTAGAELELMLELFILSLEEELPEIGIQLRRPTFLSSVVSSTRTSLRTESQ